MAMLRLMALWLGFARHLVECVLLQKSRERLGLPPDMLADASAERLAALTGMTRAELRACLELCIARLDAKRIDPGASDASSVCCQY